MLRALLGRPRTARVPVDRRYFDVQTVKVHRQPRALATRLIVTVALAFVTTQAFRYLDPLGTYKEQDALRKLREKLRKDGSTNEKNNQYGKHWEKWHTEMQTVSFPASSQAAKLSDSIRLTIPIWIRKGRLLPYDPHELEFKEFARLQGDPQRINDLKRQVAISVMESMKDTKRFHMEASIIGFDGTVREHLDIVPQLSPPPPYQVPCMWVSPKNLTASFGWRPLTSDTGARIERVFRPVVLFAACGAAARVFWSTTCAITKARFNQTFTANKDNRSTDASKQISIPQIPSKSEAEKGPITKAQEQGKLPIPVLPYLPDINDSIGTKEMHQSIVSAMPYSTAIRQAVTMFSRVKTARQKMAVSTNVRGACQIRGDLVVCGEHGLLRLEVTAHYLPAENVFLGGIEVRHRYVVIDYSEIDKRLQKADARRRARRAEQKDDKKTLREKQPDSTSENTGTDEDDKG